MSLSNGVIGLFESDGDLIERYEYTPYGQRTVYTSAGSNDVTCRSPIMESKRAVADGAPAPWGHCEFGHQGLFFDKEFGLIYDRGRYVHPILGRFMQRDRLGYQDGMNLYEYLGSNPLVHLDPFGLSAEDDPEFRLTEAWALLLDVEAEWDRLRWMQPETESEDILNGIDAVLKDADLLIAECLKRVELEEFRAEVGAHRSRYTNREIGLRLLRMELGEARYPQYLSWRLGMEAAIAQGPRKISYSRRWLDHMGIWPDPKRAIIRAGIVYGAQQVTKWWLAKHVSTALATKVSPYFWIVTGLEGLWAVHETEWDIEQARYEYDNLGSAYAKHWRDIARRGLLFRPPAPPPKSVRDLIWESYRNQKRVVPPSVLDAPPNWPSGPVPEKPPVDPRRWTGRLNPNWLKHWFGIEIPEE